MATNWGGGKMKSSNAALDILIAMALAALVVIIAFVLAVGANMGV